MIEAGVLTTFKQANKVELPKVKMKLSYVKLILFSLLVLSQTGVKLWILSSYHLWNGC